MVQHRHGSGLRDARAYLALTCSFTRRRSPTAALSVSALQGDAGHSPLVRQATTPSGVVVRCRAC